MALKQCAATRVGRNKNENIWRKCTRIFPQWRNVASVVSVHRQIWNIWTQRNMRGLWCPSMTCEIISGPNGACLKDERPEAIQKKLSVTAGTHRKQHQSSVWLYMNPSLEPRRLLQQPSRWSSPSPPFNWPLTPPRLSRNPLQPGLEMHTETQDLPIKAPFQVLISLFLLLLLTELN